MTIRFSHQLVAELHQTFWQSWQDGDFLTEATAATNTHRWRGLKWLRDAGGVRPRLGGHHPTGTRWPPHIRQRPPPARARRRPPARSARRPRPPASRTGRPAHRAPTDGQLGSGDWSVGDGMSDDGRSCAGLSLPRSSSSQRGGVNPLSRSARTARTTAGMTRTTRTTKAIGLPKPRTAEAKPATRASARSAPIMADDFMQR